jgi:hypothetical protein
MRWSSKLKIRKGQSIMAIRDEKLKKTGNFVLIET